MLTVRTKTVEISNEGIKEGGEIRDEFRAEVQSLGYDLQPYLSLWPLLFALAYQRQGMNWKRVAGLLTIVGYLIVSITFLKRAPVARTADARGHGARLQPPLHDAHGARGDARQAASRLQGAGPDGSSIPLIRPNAPG
jgi:hypothetical protein